MEHEIRRRSVQRIHAAHREGELRGLALAVFDPLLAITVEGDDDAA